MPRIEWTAELDAHVDQRLGEGARHAVIARELGITPSTLAGRLYRRRAMSAAVAVFEAAPELDPRLRPEGCRWIIGDPGAEWRWCGEAIVRGAYCMVHARQAKQKPEGIRR